MLDLDNTDILPYSGQEGRFFNDLCDEQCYLPLYVSYGRHLLLARQRLANAAGGNRAALDTARIIAQTAPSGRGRISSCASTAAFPTIRSRAGARLIASITRSA